MTGVIRAGGDKKGQTVRRGARADEAKPKAEFSIEILSQGKISLTNRTCWLTSEN